MAQNVVIQLRPLLLFGSLFFVSCDSGEELSKNSKRLETLENQLAEATAEKSKLLPVLEELMEKLEAQEDEVRDLRSALWGEKKQRDQLDLKVNELGRNALEQMEMTEGLVL